jgi:hypothetical protein
MKKPMKNKQMLYASFPFLSPFLPFPSSSLSSLPFPVAGVKEKGEGCGERV